MHNSNFCHDETPPCGPITEFESDWIATDPSTKVVSNPRSLLDHLVSNGEQSWGDREA